MSTFLATFPSFVRLARLASLALLAVAALHVLPASASEGLWTLDNLPAAPLGPTDRFQPDAAWVAHVMHASVRLDSGCSGSFVSPGGLVMTNHHCVEDCIGRLASDRHDLMRDGFLAPAPVDERRCPGLAIDRLDEIVDVEARVAQATRGLAGEAAERARQAEIAHIAAACHDADPAVHCDPVVLYGGAVRQLYRYRRFDDVRLVFVPEVDIAQFGGDPDNFNFPRHDLDLALLRAYVHGRPAASPDFFRVRRTGAAPGEPTITSGNPGATQRQETVAELEARRDVEDAARLPWLTEQRGLLAGYAAESPRNARAARIELDRVGNEAQAVEGELRALQDPALFAAKRTEEASLRALAARRPDLDAATAWDDIAAAEGALCDMAPRYRLLEGGEGLWTPWFDIARQLVRVADERARPDDQRLPGFQDAALPAVEQAVLSSTAPTSAAFERTTLAWSLGKLRQELGTDDPLVRQLLGDASPDTVAARWITETRLGDVDERRRLWRGGPAAIAASDDPFIRAARLLDAASRALARRKRDEVDAVDAVVQRATQRIARVRFAQTGLRAYPDATFTLRLSFGIVEGWDDHGRTVAPFTTVAGLYDRATGDEPFRLPPSWQDARPHLDGSGHLDFVTSNDIVGGNSGSPVLDRQARLVGLAFDGNRASLGGAFWWQQDSNRMVAVDSGFILDALDKVYHADALLKEIDAK